MTVDFGDAVWATRIEWRSLGLGNLNDFPEHLGTGSLIELDLRIDVTNRFEDARHPESGELTSQHRLRPRGRDERLCREIVDLDGLRFGKDARHRTLVEQVTGDNFDGINTRANSLVHVGARAARHADDAIALREQKLG